MSFKTPNSDKIFFLFEHYNSENKLPRNIIDKYQYHLSSNYILRLLDTELVSQGTLAILIYCWTTSSMKMIQPDVSH